MSFSLNVIAPDRHVFETEDAMYVLLTGRRGQVAIEDDHAPELIALSPGVCEVRYGEEKVQRLFISGGFARVGVSMTTLLADSAEKVEDVDVDRAEAAKTRAEKRLAGKGDRQIDVARAQSALARALARLKVSAARSETT